ncbi:hypothetical protein ACIBAG_09885 [Streptomyces sp. NPDC051243]|uniref:hypothetical protein n=1 Tax=Streptomyces sp. NPDC051243 TaxID=3365646 RepID=UPI0037A1830C
MITDLFGRKADTDRAHEELLRCLADDVEGLSARVGKLEASMNALRELATHDRTDMPDETFLVHTDIADSFRKLVQQMIEPAAGAVMGRWRAASDEPLSEKAATRAEAHIVSHLTRVLFEDQAPALSDTPSAEAVHHLRQHDIFLDPDELEPLWAEARRIIQKTNAARHACEWNFACVRGASLNSRQKAWGPCRAEDPVDFVMAPAYVVTEGDTMRVCEEQLVFTSPWLSGGERPG